MTKLNLRVPPISSVIRHNSGPAFASAVKIPYLAYSFFPKRDATECTRLVSGTCYLDFYHRCQ